MNFKKIKIRYRKKLQEKMEILDAVKRTNTISNRRKQQCNVSKTNNGLLHVCQCHKMSIPIFRYKMQT